LCVTTFIKELYDDDGDDDQTINFWWYSLLRFLWHRNSAHLSLLSPRYTTHHCRPTMSIVILVPDNVGTLTHGPTTANKITSNDNRQVASQSRPTMTGCVSWPLSY